MSGLRIFSNGMDATYNNYYNNRVSNAKACPADPKKPPMTVVQASTSYRYDGEAIRKKCNNDGRMYPYGQYSASRIFLEPPIRPPVDPLVEQAILEYGISTNICETTHLERLDDDDCVGTCLGEIHSSVHCGTNLPGNGGHGIGEHLGIIGEKGCNDSFQLEMEQLKAYRFKCYECINPCCPANMLALQYIRESRLNKSGTTTTTMTYGSTGTTTTTTTTIKI